MDHTSVNYQGRKKRIGSLIRMSDGKLGIFVGYCPNTACKGRIALDYDNARIFTDKFRKQKKRLANRMLIKLLHRLERLTD